MNEAEDYAGELTDDFLNAQADSGDYYCDEQGYQFLPTQEEMKAPPLPSKVKLSTWSASVLRLSATAV